MKKKKELLYSLTKKDFDLQTFRSGGPGGQHQNKRDTGVRIIHRESGAVGECRSTRSQAQNKKMALSRLVEHPKFQVWHIKKCSEIIEGKSLDELVEEMMNPKNMKCERQNSKGQWVEWPDWYLDERGE